MALFTINRFMGDDTKVEDEATNKKQADILARLHQKAERRRKEELEKKELESNSVEETDLGKSRKRSTQSDTDSPDVKKKKRKQKSDKFCDDTNVIEEAENNKNDFSKQSEEPNKEDEEQSSLPKDIQNVVTGGDESIGDVEKKHEKKPSKRQTHKEIGGYTIIGEVKQQKKKKVSRVLPDWLAKPSIIHNDLSLSKIPIDKFEGLDEDLMAKLKKNKIDNLFPVQAQVIPVLLHEARNGYLFGNTGYRPSDICCSAPTGSGKTLAFVLPIVQVLRSRVVCKIRAMAVLPVRDLAIQVFQVFESYCRNTGLKVALLAGQGTLVQEQENLFRKGVRGVHSKVDIIVCTPGRLVDHLKQTQHLDLSQLRYLVIDEADRMMDQLNQDWLSQLENHIYHDTDIASSTGIDNQKSERPDIITAANQQNQVIPLQKLLFSATLSQNPEKLQEIKLFKPRLFTSIINENLNTDKNSSSGEFIGKYTTPAGLKEYVVPCGLQEKPLILLHFLHNLNMKRILCFTNSVQATHRLYHLIKHYGGAEVEEFSSMLGAKKRNKMLKRFSDGKINILISSDALARGIDVDSVQYVVSYDAPAVLKTYIHRVGRTARAGKEGTAYTLLPPKEANKFQKMLKSAGKSELEVIKYEEEDLEPLVETYKTALTKLADTLEDEKKRMKYK